MTNARNAQTNRVAPVERRGRAKERERERARKGRENEREEEENKPIDKPAHKVQKFQLRVFIHSPNRACA